MFFISYLVSEKPPKTAVGYSDDVKAASLYQSPTAENSKKSPDKTDIHTDGHMKFVYWAC
jgi:hypothetical protein